MKLLLLAALVALTPVLQGPAIDSEEADLVVLKFTWTKFRQNSDLIHSVSDPGSINEPVSIKPASPKNEPPELRNKRDLQERRAEMLATEKSATQSSRRNQDQYLLRLEVKNVGTNVVKSVVWEYQPAAQTADYELRQYLCALKAKPNESKTFELVSTFAPAKVVEADTKPGKDKDGKVVINRIEYADGSIWKRMGWSVLIPDDLTGKMGNGKCFGF